jgi:hypothetical protein
MKKILLPLLALASLLLQAPAWAATYTFTGPTYTTVTPHAACGSPPCPDFDTTMYQRGSFTTAAPLAASQNNADISALITSYDFNDGITHYTSGGANDFLQLALVTTDAAGNVLTAAIVPVQWRGASHGVNDRLNAMATSVNADSWSNAYCQTAGGPPGTCLQPMIDASSSRANVNAVGIWVTGAPVPAPSPAAVPLLGTEGLAALALLTGVFGMRRARRR